MSLWFKNTTIQRKILAEDEYENAHLTLRRSLIQQYRTRLKCKLAFPMSINIGGKPTTFGTSEGYVNDYQLNKNLTFEHEDIQGEIGKILTSHGRLLLIGDAGSGKTTILLFASLDLLLQEDNYQLPLMLNLATWQKDFKFEEWYERNIAESYNLSRAFAKTLIQKKDILPFFDGFDEIGEAHRGTLFDVMRDYFGSDKANRFIISSRKLAYHDANTDAPVYAQYEVKLLTLSQIRTALTLNAEKYGSENALLNAINQNPHLQEAVLNPFYLNTASFVYEKMGRMTFKAVNTEGIQKEMVEMFVDNQVPDKQDKMYLRFLASNMNKRNMIVFELRDLQYNWECDWSTIDIILANTVGYAVNEFIRGIIFGVFLGILAGLYQGFITGLAVLICFYFGIGPLYGFFVSLIDRKLLTVEQKQIVIQTKDTINWNLKKNYKLFQFQGELFVYFILYSTIYYMLNRDNITVEMFIIIVLILAIIFLWFFSNRLFNIMSNQFSHILFIKKPYQRFINSAKSLHFSIFQHYLLRYQFYKEGKLPLKLISFLNEMYSRLLLETDGATWRFRHKILQDYFAEMTFKE